MNLSSRPHRPTTVKSDVVSRIRPPKRGEVSLSCVGKAPVVRRDNRSARSTSKWGVVTELRSWVICACLATAAFYSNAAFADESPATTQDARVGSHSTNAAATTTTTAQPGSEPPLEEIVVTAQKRPELLRDVPTAETVVSNASLNQSDALGLEDYFHFVPSLTAEESGIGSTQVSIRGISTGGLTFGVGQNPTVAIYIDDVPFGSSTALGLGDSIFPDLDPSDLQQIEVLKGPQGTLYGASSLGGLIKFDTKEPDLTQVTGRIEADTQAVMDHGTGGGVRGRVSVPLIENTLAIQVSGFTREDPGFIENVEDHTRNANVAHDDGGRVSMVWKPDAAFSLKLSALYQSRTADDSDQEIVNPQTYRPLYGDLTHDNFSGTDRTHQQIKVYDAIATYDMGAATLTSITSYSASTIHFYYDITSQLGATFDSVFDTPDLATLLNLNSTTGKSTEELRLSSNGTNRLDWQVGAFLTRENSLYLENLPIYSQQTQHLEPFPPILNAVIVSHYNEYAGYGDLMLHITDQLKVQGGIRYSKNDQNSIENIQGILGIPPQTPILTSAGVATYLATASYQLGKNVLTYVRFATGYRPGGPNLDAGGAPQTYGPDTTNNYEFGVKGDFLDRVLSIDFDAFHIDWRRIQLEALAPNQFSYFLNGGTAASDGVEGTVGVRPFRGLVLSVTASYEDSRLTSAAPPGLYAFSGSQLPYSPKFSGSATANYTFPLSTRVNAVVGGDYSYAGQRPSNFAKTATIPRFVIPSYSLLGLHTGLEWDGYSAMLFLKNATNARAFLGGGDIGPNGTGPAAVTVAQPRTMAFSIAKDF
jgi:iron complex outermembrane recepter protein